MKVVTIKYKISTYPSKFMGYHSKNKENGEVKLYILTIWKSSLNKFDDFVYIINHIIILERICLERAFQKIRMKNRCKPCKMEKYAMEMMKY